jgi:tungstate transport system permease protein
MLTFEKIQSAIFITLYVSIFSTIISFILSMFFGYILAIYQFKLKKSIVIFLSSMTSIPPVCAGLLVYLLISRSGPLGWMEILYSPFAMILAQIVITFPIMITLIIKNIETDYPIYKEELLSYGASKKDIIFLLISNKLNIYITVILVGFGRAISEYGAAAIVGGSIDHFTRNMTATIALETSKGNVSLGIILGAILISLTLIISIILNTLKND